MDLNMILLLYRYFETSRVGVTLSPSYSLSRMKVTTSLLLLASTLLLAVNGLATRNAPDGQKFSDAEAMPHFEEMGICFFFLNGGDHDKVLKPCHKYCHETDNSTALAVSTIFLNLHYFCDTFSAWLQSTLACLLYFRIIYIFTPAMLIYLTFFSS